MKSPNAVAAEDANQRTTGATPYHAGGGRRKATAANRSWLVISDSGRSYVEEAGKHSIMRRTGLPARDLRVLDPQLSYPSTILGRERAIVINLEHIKAVITATEVLIPNSRDPLVAPFVQDLQTKVSSSYGAPQHGPESGEMDAQITTMAVSNGQAHAGSPIAALNGYNNGDTKALPFEFIALEVCLESACRLLESETSTLEQEAYPALDELTSKISTLNLERVRQIKSRLVAISGRVQKVRDELEHLLDDDMDMAEMFLTEKLAHQRAGETSSRVDIRNDDLEVDEDGDGDDKTETESRNESFSGFKLNIEELEMLLEAYFVQIDGTLNKLSTLREYVDDTEDYINIILDEKQNQLLQMGVMLSTATLVVTVGVVVVALFGMNIKIELFNVETYHQFLEATFGTVGGCFILYILAIGWGKKSGLLQ